METSDKNIVCLENQIYYYLRPWRRLILPWHCEGFLIEKKIPYILRKTSKIIVGYKINTAYNQKIIFPVIGLQNLKIKLKIKKQVIYKTTFRSIIKSTPLPDDVIRIIINFMNIIL
tara:strand:- start:1436 stop:1783 length:348 start_codon:yes stop_codon:yes gene_type:complete